MQSWTHRTVATAMIFALIVTGWKVVPIIGALDAWTAWDQPKVASQLLSACIWGLIALALGLGLNVGTLARSLGIPLPDLTAASSSVPKE